MSTKIVLPNVRKLFAVDPGYVMYEADLKGADAQVVAWEAEDEELKAAFRAGLDVHVKNAEDMWGTEFSRLAKGSHARHEKRQLCKRGVHLTNYGGSERGMAQALGLTAHEASKFQRRWFSIHPGILRWHDRIRHLLATTRTIHNAFGFRRIYFDRIDSCFTEALAWIPQSTVAINTYHGALQLEKRYWPEQQELGWSPPAGEYAGIMLQTHDSLNPQFKIVDCPPEEEIRQTLNVVTPYDDPLIIPWDLKKSTKSWGEMEKC
jgi:DNA polymerase-1